MSLAHPLPCGWQPQACQGCPMPQAVWVPIFHNFRSLSCASGKQITSFEFSLENAAHLSIPP